MELRSRIRAALRAREGDNGSVASDGLPLPPVELRQLVAINVDDSSFLETGRREARMISDTLARQGLRLDDFGAILDFGCGCGRVLRHWQPLAASVQIHGSDYNADLVAWCRASLPFAHFAVNPPGPPLVYQTGKFDFVTAFSVFTHLPEELEPLWLDELTRVLKRAGHLLFTTHGRSYSVHLSEDERRRFDDGDAVFHVDGAPGTNAFNSFHPPEAVERLLAERFHLVEHVPGTGAYHDVWLVRKHDEPSD
jgi:SAM-dependent methyltransferase